MARHKNVNWDLLDVDRNNRVGTDTIQAAVLMDIRDALQELRTALAPLRHLDCPNFQSVPLILSQIQANTRKPRRKVKK